MPVPRRSSHADQDVERLSKARASQAHNELIQQARAMRTVDDHAIDPTDREMLVDMLGLENGRPMAEAPARPVVGPLI
jgi:hypothetical protein